MQDTSDAFTEALRLITTLDRDLVEIILMSLRVSLFAVLFAMLIGLPVGATTAISRFPDEAPSSP